LLHVRPNKSKDFKTKNKITIAMTVIVVVVIIIINSSISITENFQTAILMQFSYLGMM